ncbi:hypothetical protein [Nocardia sp. CDC160]|uniref:hypothetical protein n=1 Tax=Nocardia sp. CDC160 TaxID=3112166 RepID=UPI002DB5E955|nr:hypothetical protein [Nocardia sp. CDC160]MEC3915628.1 hypothetical protein [Nocardia sp. CDC160]
MDRARRIGRGRRFRAWSKGLGVALAVGLIGYGSPAAAEPIAAVQPPDPTYPFTELGILASGPLHDLQTPGMLDFWVRAGVLDNLGHVSGEFKDLLDPATYLAPDARQRQLAAAQKIWDAFTHNTPFGLSTPPHPDLLPNWSHDGNFTDNVADAQLDDDYDNPAAREAQFRLPCVNPDGTVFFENTDGLCVAGDTATTFRMGTVKKFEVIDSLGIPLIAKVWFPEGAETSGQKYPVTVMAPGATSPQHAQAMELMEAARAGFISISFDQAGNATNPNGNVGDMFLPLLGDPHCATPGGCHDVQDMVRWVNRMEITPVADPNNEIGNVLRGMNPRLVRANPAFAPTGDNIENPWADLMDLDHVNLWGQSYGSVGVTTYPYYQSIGVGMDGRPLPKVSSIVGLSGFSYGPAVIPMQLQTADFDIPVPAGFAITHTPNGILDATDGAIGTKELYDTLRRDHRGDAPLQFINIEGGTHGEAVNWPFIPRNVASKYLSNHYAISWFQCYGRADADENACAALKEPQAGLSRAVPSEYSPEGPAGPSLCLNIPDRATLAQAVFRPDDFLQANWGTPRYDCTPQQ